MRTTLDIDDHVLLAAKDLARRQRKSAGEVLSDLARQGLQGERRGVGESTPRYGFVPAPASGVVFSGDTLFCGGPGATGRSYSDEPTILRSIRDRLLAMPDHTIVHTGHGDSTTIGAERERVLARAAELGV